MKKCIFLMTAFSIFLLSCSSPQNFYSSKLVNSSAKSNNQNIHTVEARGPMTLTIIDGSAQDKINISGIKKIGDGIITSCSAGVLFIKGSSDSNNIIVMTKHLNNLNLINMSRVIFKAKKTSQLKIYARNVYRLRLDGKIHIDVLKTDGALPKNIEGNERLWIKSFQNEGTGSVMINGFHSRSVMTVTNFALSNLVLRGYVETQKIIQRGSGVIDIRWLNDGQSTSVDASAGKIKLAGRTKKLDMVATHHALIDAAYLRANEVRVRSADNAVVKVNVLNQMFAHAFNSSRIYYQSHSQRIYTEIDPTAMLIKTTWD